MVFYAVARGRQTGIFKTWTEAESHVKKFTGAVFKKFQTNQEAQAFIDARSHPAKKPKLEAQFSKKVDSASKPTTSSSDSDEEAFLTLEEFPDQPDKEKPSTSSRKRKVPTNKTEDPNAIKYEPPQPTNPKVYNGHTFQEDSLGFVHVYTDGSCENNGKHGAAAGFGVYFGDDHPLNESAPVKGRPTNNVGEIQAAIHAIKHAQDCAIKRLNIFTDSQFLMNSVCKWMAGWKRKDWTLSTGKKVINEKDFKELDSVIESSNVVIKWSYVPAHKGHHGNEEADKLAKIGASFNRRNRKAGKDADS